MIAMRGVPQSGTFGQLAAALSTAHGHLTNGQQGVGGGPEGTRERYLDAVHKAMVELQSHLSRGELDRMLRPAVYLAVLGAASTDQQLVQAINGEYERLKVMLEQQRGWAVHQEQYWGAAGALVLPDTSYWIQEWRSFESVDFEELFKQHGEPEMTLVVPMVVVDELDGVAHKRGDHAAWRAKKASRFIQDFAGGPSAGPAVVRPRNLTVENMAVKLAVVDFPPDHQRTPINDDEIVGVGATLAAATGRKVLLASCDTAGFPLRARLAGQQCLNVEVPPNPDRPSGKRSPSPRRQP